MPIMTWDSTLDIGVPAMNAEHLQILDAMNRIYDAANQGKSGGAVNKLVAELGEICVKHFADEERFMEEVGYPGLKSHKLIHAQLLKDFTHHADAIRERGGKAGQDFFGFLKLWLSAHIRGIDIKYGEHAKTSASLGSDA